MLQGTEQLHEIYSSLFSRWSPDLYIVKIDYIRKLYAVKIGFASYLCKKEQNPCDMGRLSFSVIDYGRKKSVEGVKL